MVRGGRASSQAHDQGAILLLRRPIHDLALIPASHELRVERLGIRERAKSAKRRYRFGTRSKALSTDGPARALESGDFVAIHRRSPKAGAHFGGPEPCAEASGGCARLLQLQVMAPWPLWQHALTSVAAKAWWQGQDPPCSCVTSTRRLSIQLIWDMNRFALTSRRLLLLSADDPRTDQGWKRV